MVVRKTPYGPPVEVKYKIYKERCGAYVLEYENADGSGCPRSFKACKSVSDFVENMLVERFPHFPDCHPVVFTLDGADEPVEPALKLELAAAGAE